MTAILEHQRNGAKPAHAIVDPAQVPMTPAHVAVRRLVQGHVERISQPPICQARHPGRHRAVQRQHGHREPAADPPQALEDDPPGKVVAVLRRDPSLTPLLLTLAIDGEPSARVSQIGPFQRARRLSVHVGDWKLGDGVYPGVALSAAREADRW